MEDISEEAETSKSERQRQRTEDLSDSSNDSFKSKISNTYIVSDNVLKNRQKLIHPWCRCLMTINEIFSFVKC